MAVLYQFPWPVWVALVLGILAVVRILKKRQRERGARRCRTCAGNNPPEARFCRRCGARM